MPFCIVLYHYCPIFLPLKLYVAKNSYVGGSSSIQHATSVRQLDILYLTRDPFGLCSCPRVAEAKIKTNDGEKYKYLISELLKYNACNAIYIYFYCYDFSYCTFMYGYPD